MTYTNGIKPIEGVREMIIAAHAGTGKTYFSKNISDSVDFVCMPYKYYLPDGFIAGEDDETVKADMNLNIREEWPDNYCKAVINAYNEHKYVIIPPVGTVLAALRDEEIPYILCYPDRTLKAEYESRYRARGNSESFLRVFVDHWDLFMNDMESDPGDNHVVLKEGEYLLFYFSYFDIVISEKESIVSFEIDEKVLSGFNSIYAKTGYSFQTFARREFIKIAKSGEWPVILNKRELEKEL